MDDEEQTTDIEVEPGRDYTRQRWLSRVMSCKVNARGGDGKRRVKIPKVWWDVSDKTYYEPEAVSIGPYHYNKDDEKLSYFQELKDEFAFTLFGKKKEDVQEAYDKLSKVLPKARGYYSQDAIEGMTSDEVFTEVMFLDGCFVLEFMSRLQQTRGFTTQAKLDLVVRDLLLLDNQVPFIVLQALDRRRPANANSLTSDAVNLFAYAFSYGMFPGITYDKFPKKTQPTHLLDFLSLWLYDPRDKPPRILLSGEWMACPSVTRLEEAGIDCRRTDSPRVTAIRFTPKILTAELKIPPMYVEEDSKPYWMNLAAYQIYAAGDEGASCSIGAVEYIWMMEKLIDDAKDVKKLRAKQIILHGLGKDRKVVDLFQTMSQNIKSDLLGMNARFPVPWDKAFHNKERLLMEEIQNHLRSKFKRWCYRNLYRPYFRSPWSIPAFFAGFIGLFLTFLQVYYAIYPRH